MTTVKVDPYKERTSVDIDCYQCSHEVGRKIREKARPAVWAFVNALATSRRPLATYYCDEHVPEAPIQEADDEQVPAGTEKGD